jgi:peptidoglycan/xylan/chitin deacetylase (PgdA/CDA1 family)
MVSISIVSFETVFAEQTQTVEVEIKYTNGDRADFNGMKLIVYQDFSKEIFLEKQLENNPDFITVPENHRYKIEVYANGMYADVGYLQADNTSKYIQINIPLSGGLKFEIFYEDGETPIENARVIIKSQDNTEWRQGITNQLGETIRYWIQSTTISTDHYIADIFLGDVFLKSEYPIKLQSGLAKDEKIIIGIPEIVEDLISISLYNNATKKITPSDGEFTVTLSEKFGEDSISREVDFRGQAKFSNLKTGAYIAKITPNQDKSWPETEILIIGEQNQFNIFKNIMVEKSITPELQSIESCNCVAFRFDDVQDYWLNDVQIQFMQTFVDKNIPLTIGVIADSFGDDSKMLEFVQSQKNNNFDVASHGIGNIPFTEFSKEDQDSRLKQSTQLIKGKLDVVTTVFIPPQNRFNEDTKQILIENGFTHISSSLLHGESPPFPFRDEQLYRFPEIGTTGTFEPTQNIFVGLPQEETFGDVIKGLENYGFAVITSHPQEFSTVVNGTYVNEPNTEQISELVKLIDRLQQEGIKIVLIKDISSDSQFKQVPVWIKNNAGWWADGSINDETFIQGIEYLVQQEIIKISEKSQTETVEQNVPVWIKNNAGWWADGSINDETFIQGIEYLVKTGIITY